MYTFLMFLSIIIALLLIVMILLQASKGGGLAGTFGGAANVGAMFGTRRTADFLSKSTWWLAGVLVLLALLINLFYLPGTGSGSDRRSIIQESGRSTAPTTPTLPQNK